MYDVIIIGGGVVGCAIARELSQYRLSIALLEKHSEPSRVGRRTAYPLLSLMRRGLTAGVNTRSLKKV